MFVETDYIHSLSMLWNPACGVNDGDMEIVLKPSESVLNYTPRVTSVVGPKVLYVLKKNDRWALVFNDVCKNEKQIALIGAVKAVRLSEALLLRNAGNRKRLTWKARCENIVVWNIGRSDFSDVPVWRISEPLSIGFLRVLIPLDGKPTLATEPVEGQSKTADAREQIHVLEGYSLARHARLADHCTCCLGGFRLIKRFHPLQHFENKLLFGLLPLPPFALDPRMKLVWNMPN